MAADPNLKNASVLLGFVILHPTYCAETPVDVP